MKRIECIEQDGNIDNLTVGEAREYLDRYPDEAQIEFLCCSPGGVSFKVSMDRDETPAEEEERKQHESGQLIFIEWEERSELSRLLKKYGRE